MPEPYPFYSQVPTDRRENLVWRLAVCRLAIEQPSFVAEFRQMCADDPLFFIQSSCWLYEPRANKQAKQKSRVLPFILWPHQLRVAKEILACWGVRDVVIEKSRAEGASWLVLMLGLHSWLFDPMFTMGLISKDEDSVDERGDMNAQMPKLDWALTRLPAWLRPKKVNRTDLKLVNCDNDSIFTGYAATGDAASGGRTTVFMMDELAKFPKGADYAVLDSTQAVTECRIFVSTPKGDVGAFYDKAHDNETTKVVLDWKENPTKNRGLYRVKDGQITVVDPVNNPIDPLYLKRLPDVHRRLEDKGFKLEGTTRSEWYNTQCLRSNPTSVAQEIDHNYGKAAEKHFEKEVIQTLIDRQARKPVQVGRVKIQDDMSVIWQAINGGLVKIWCPLGGPEQRPPRRVYGAGADVSHGTGGAFSSNSVLIIGDLATGEQMFEFAHNAMKVPEFTRLSVAVCRWFYEATINWDANGAPGILFGQFLKNTYEYANVLYSPTLETGPNRSPGKSPGTHNHTDESKTTYLTDTIEDALHDKLLIRSEATAKEFGEFGYKDGKLVHLKAARTQSEGNKGKAHGDRATAMAMFNLVRREMGSSLESTPEKPPDEKGPLVQVSWPCAANRILAHRKSQPSKLVWY